MAKIQVTSWILECDRMHISSKDYLILSVAIITCWNRNIPRQNRLLFLFDEAHQNELTIQTQIFARVLKTILRRWINLILIEIVILIWHESLKGLSLKLDRNHFICFYDDFFLYIRPSETFWKIPIAKITNMSNNIAVAVLFTILQSIFFLKRLWQELGKILQ